MFNKKIAYISALLIFFVTLYGSYSFFSNNTSFNIVPKIIQYKAFNEGEDGKLTSKPDEPKTEACPLNGQLFSKTQRKNWEKRRPLGIMVENHTEARPQSGLSVADVVYEAVAEGGITRFLAVFYCDDANIIGPVRSARIYFIRLLQEYGRLPLYAHVGGANTDGPADALGEVEDLGWAQYNDLNQFSVPFPNFWRDYDRLPNRATEHTVYTSSSKLWDFAKSKRGLGNEDKKGKSWDEKFTEWKFRDDAKIEDRGEGESKISFSFWNSFALDYAVAWTYDKERNVYKRENGGSSHLDKSTNKQLEAKNVVVVFADESPANDGYAGGHILYDLMGTGKALVFQDGQVTMANWKKKDEENRLTLTDTNNESTTFVRGKIFIEILPTGNKVTY